MNRSFFDILFRNMTVENVVIVFTHLLVGRGVVIVGSQAELMLPIVTSLANLIHPFEVMFCLPLIKSDPDISVEKSPLMVL